jgi:hypothetical protein
MQLRQKLGVFTDIGGKVPKRDPDAAEVGAEGLTEENKRFYVK